MVRASRRTRQASKQASRGPSLPACYIHIPSDSISTPLHSSPILEEEEEIYQSDTCEEQEINERKQWYVVTEKAPEWTLAGFSFGWLSGDWRRVSALWRESPAAIGRARPKG